MMSKQNVPELRFPEFSGEWEERTLENISNIYDGTHATPDYVSEGIPFFSVENVSRKDFVNSKYVSREAYEVYKKRVEVEFNDILMTRIGSIGNVKRVDWHFPSTFYVSLALLKLKKGFVPKYIEQLLKSPTVQKNIVRNSLVTAVPQKINLVDLKQVKINLATSKSEQLKIGEFLSKVDRLIELEEKKLELLEEQKKGYMQKIFSQELRFKDEKGNDYPEWQKKNFYECVSIKNNLVDPRLPNYQNYPHVGPGNIEKKTGKLLNYNLVKDENLISGKFEFNEFDVIYGKINPQLQKIAYPGFRGLASADTYPISSIGGVSDPTFIYYNLFTNEFFKYSVSVSMRTGIPKINRNELGNYKFLLPILVEQQKIGDFLSKLDNIISLQKEKVKIFKTKKKSLLQKMLI